MSENYSSPRDMSTMMRGGFFFLLGPILLLYVIMPRHFLGVLVAGGAIGMLLYGGHILKIHTFLTKIFRKISKD